MGTKFENFHDPSEYIRNLQQLLSSDKKKLGFLFGAGTSLINNPQTNKPYVPAIAKMTEQIVGHLNSDPLFKTALEDIKTELNDHYTIETILSSLELKKKVVGKGKLNGLNVADLENLIKQIKKQIRSVVGIQSNIEPSNLVHSDFAEWIGKASRKYGVEIFTTNYDYLFEMGLEYKAVPYYDGFTGSYNPFFCGESVDDFSFLPSQTKLWKIHGSLGWHYDDKNKRVLRKDSDSDDILIYPSTLKYDQSRKQPYMALGDRLTKFVKQPDTVLIVCGYSFGDEHINDRLISALNSNGLGHIYVLYYDKYTDPNGKFAYSLKDDETDNLAKLAKSNSKISVFGFRSAIIGGVYGKWRLKQEPDKDDSINIDNYYDEDAYSSTEDEMHTKLTQKWTGEGEFILPDFEKFVRFLNSMVLKSI